MGWSKGVNYAGEDVGYAVPATCSEPDCGAEINRGLAYTCGGLQGHDGETCGKPFCGEHLFYGAPGVRDAVCTICFEAIEQDEGDA